MIWRRHRKNGPSHAWEQDAAGHYHTACRFVSGQWTLAEAEPTPTRKCPHCIRRLKTGDELTALKRKLVRVWPRGLTVTELRGAHPRLRNPERLALILDELVASRAIYYAESKSGRRRYAASVRLREAMQENPMIQPEA